MKIFSLFIPILILISCSQQTKLTKEKGEKKAKLEYYVLKKDKSIKHGSFKEYNKFGNMVTDGNYSKNERVGIWTHYWEGKIKEVYLYVNDTAFLITRYKDAKINSLSIYEQGKKRFSHVFGEDGKIKSTSFFEDGDLKRLEKESKIYEYYENRKVIISFDKLSIEKKDIEIKIPRIKYPRIAVENNIEGTVTLKIWSKNNCESIKTEIVEPSKYKFFNEEALMIAEKYIALIKKYDPNRCKSFEETLPVIFKLK